MGDELRQAAIRELARRELERRGIQAPPDPYGLGGPADLTRQHQQKISPGRAMALGGAQGGTLGFVDEGAGAYSALTSRPPARLGKAFAPSPDDTPEQRAIKEDEIARRLEQLRPGGDPLSYESVRDMVRAEAAQAAKDQPAYYNTGEVLGGVGAGGVTGALPLHRIGAGVAGNTARMFASGAGQGAVQGLGESNAPLGSARSARDILAGAGLGAGGEVSGLLATKFAAPVARRLGKAAEGEAITSTRRLMLNGADQLSSRAKMDDAIPEAVLKAGAVWPLGTMEGTAKRIASKREAASKVYGDIIATLEKEGVPGPNARALADQLLAQADAIEPRTMTEAIPRLYRKQADTVIDKSALGEAQGIAPTGRLGLSQSEDLKRSLQNEARYGKVEDTPINEAKQDIASILRQANEDAILEASQANPTPEIVEAAQSFVPAKQHLGKMIEADDALQRGVARSSTRQGPALGPFELSAAAMSGNVAPLATPYAREFLRGRGRSTYAAAMHGLGRALQSQGLRVGPTAMRWGGGLGSVAARALGMRPEPPAGPEPPPEGADADFERWRLEQELRGNSRPSGAPLRRLVKKGRQ